MENQPLIQINYMDGKQVVPQDAYSIEISASA